MDEDFRSLLLTTTDSGQLTRTMCPNKSRLSNEIRQLSSNYDSIIQGGRVSWTSHLRFRRKLGAGGQGVVYLTQQLGADEFTLPVALKIFAPNRYVTTDDYEAAMARVARVSAKIARIQHDNLVQIQNFLERDRIRMLLMEWVDGYDLRRLLTPTMLGKVRETVSEKRWRYINEVLATQGEVQPKFKPGIAISIVRDCLEALAALHRRGVIHGDIKPANIMLKRSGHAKIIDTGSAIDLDDLPPKRTCTPAYAALEILQGGESSPQSDLASLGFVLLELLAGKPVFSGIKKLDELIDAKANLAENLPNILPHEVAVNELLMSFCRGLIAPLPEQRFLSAEAADLMEYGAAEFHRQLVKSNLASEYENDIRIWIEELLEMDGELFGSEPDAA